jgi:hypothetical protein
MNEDNENKAVKTLEDVLNLLDQSGLTGTRRRDMVSAVKGICEMFETMPAGVPAQPLHLRELLSRIRPAAHGVTAKSYSNLRSLFAAALQPAGVIDPLGRGSARRHPEWRPLLEAIVDDKRLSSGLATFANWCGNQHISPGEVNDTTVQRFLAWLEARTLQPKPRDLVRRVPKLWNEASTKFNCWPATKLATLSFKAPSRHLNWSDRARASNRMPVRILRFVPIQICLMNGPKPRNAHLPPPRFVNSVSICAWRPPS